MSFPPRGDRKSAFTHRPERVYDCIYTRCRTSVYARRTGVEPPAERTAAFRMLTATLNSDFWAQSGLTTIVRGNRDRRTTLLSQGDSGDGLSPDGSQVASVLPVLASLRGK